MRWRADGRLLCAAKCAEEPNDTYIDDRLQYQLSVISRAILPDVDEATTGLWHWTHDDRKVLLARNIAAFQDAV